VNIIDKLRDPKKGGKIGPVNCVADVVIPLVFLVLPPNWGDKTIGFFRGDMGQGCTKTLQTGVVAENGSQATTSNSFNGEWCGGNVAEKKTVSRGGKNQMVEIGTHQGKKEGEHASHLFRGKKEPTKWFRELK